MVGKGAASLPATKIMVVATLRIAANAPLMNFIISSTGLNLD
ncbi:hypothetical protein BF49_3541 [Bradyrhizobium sp.]|nr:hypothetical protein BF49_3541 [Bradyrhizobium sp.]